MPGIAMFSLLCECVHRCPRPPPQLGGIRPTQRDTWKWNVASGESPRRPHFTLSQAACPAHAPIGSLQRIQESRRHAKSWLVQAMLQPLHWAHTHYTRRRVEQPSPQNRKRICSRQMHGRLAVSSIADSRRRACVPRFATAHHAATESSSCSLHALCFHPLRPQGAKSGEGQTARRMLDSVPGYNVTGPSMSRFGGLHHDRIQDRGHTRPSVWHKRELRRQTQARIHGQTGHKRSPKREP